VHRALTCWWRRRKMHKVSSIRCLYERAEIGHLHVCGCRDAAHDRRDGARREEVRRVFKHDAKRYKVISAPKSAAPPPLLREVTVADVQELGNVSIAIETERRTERGHHAYTPRGSPTATTTGGPRNLNYENSRWGLFKVNSPVSRLRHRLRGRSGPWRVVLGAWQRRSVATAVYQ